MAYVTSGIIQWGSVGGSHETDYYVGTSHINDNNYGFAIYWDKIDNLIMIVLCMPNH